MNEAVEHVLKSMKFYQNTYPDDACIVVTDTDKVLAYLPGENIDFKMNVGDPVEKYQGTVAFKALIIGKKLREERNAEAYGIAYVASATPIIDNGETVGVLNAIVKNDRLNTLRNSASELAAMVEKMSATSDLVTEASNSVAERIGNLAETSEGVQTDVEKIKSIVSFVHEVANQSNLLGLNAAIEAARAGEHGRGFTVVANEVRKLAEKSKDSAKEIEDQLFNIQTAVELLNESVQQITANMVENAASVQELKAAIDHIAKKADSLALIAD
ncbi:methyl-accepting chemotaxis protein [Heyndrickxia acidicola]|uniref:Methyl-accepting chemotaxis protein n=1 Tax=Heyndrickxia acidicola TaxID=209389 RepID=A0ABU6MN89_9BACI|nr:methyl-accepting chemotaxis protein [Heyndrickxia acidicola]MED1205974.1 methyl-accepting chemotaxis protein [Heyndrickxia acidicola]